MAITKYLPAPAGQLPVNLEVRRFLEAELGKIADVLNADQIMIEPQAAEPLRPENGVITYADGVNWDPGAGEGFYGYEAGAWVKI